MAQASCAIFAWDILANLFLYFLIKVVVILVGALYAIGVCDLMFIGLLDMWMSVGSIEFSLLATVHFVFAGSLLFCLGHGQNTLSGLRRMAKVRRVFW